MVEPYKVIVVGKKEEAAEDEDPDFKEIKMLIFANSQEEAEELALGVAKKEKLHDPHVIYIYKFTRPFIYSIDIPYIVEDWVWEIMLDKGIAKRSIPKPFDLGAL
uniref:Uncharacterized protein n=1 Tax=Thermococcus sp. CIR10 TaxID=1197731 RepID=L0BAG2_9EURY|nr:hypothetical protein [Thermococcus sp. CIR10]AFZ84266.1 hypothetical protein c10-10 [Thermococcus sp. CIR10]